MTRVISMNTAINGVRLDPHISFGSRLTSLFYCIFRSSAWQGTFRDTFEKIYRQLLFLRNLLKIYFVTELTKSKMVSICVIQEQKIFQRIYLCESRGKLLIFETNLQRDKARHDKLQNKCKNLITLGTGNYVKMYLKKNHCLKSFYEELLPRPFSEFSPQTILNK